MSLAAPARVVNESLITDKNYLSMWRHFTLHSAIFFRPVIILRFFRISIFKQRMFGRSLINGSNSRFTKVIQAGLNLFRTSWPKMETIKIHHLKTGTTKIICHISWSCGRRKRYRLLWHSSCLRETEMAKAFGEHLNHDYNYQSPLLQSC